jgi:hypothetical protein
MRDEISNILYSSFRLHPSSFIKREELIPPLEKGGRGDFEALFVK